MRARASIERLRRITGLLRPSRGWTSAAALVMASASPVTLAACSCRSRSRQCRPSSVRPNSSENARNATNGGTRSDPRSRRSTSSWRASSPHFGIGGLAPNGTSVGASAGSTLQVVTTAYCGLCRLTWTHGQPPPKSTLDPAEQPAAAGDLVVLHQVVGGRRVDRELALGAGEDLAGLLVLGEDQVAVDRGLEVGGVGLARGAAAVVDVAHGGDLRLREVAVRDALHRDPGRDAALQRVDRRRVGEPEQRHQHHEARRGRRRRRGTRGARPCWWRAAGWACRTKSATAAMTTSTPRIVGYQRSRFLMPSAAMTERVCTTAPTGSARTR